MTQLEEIKKEAKEKKQISITIENPWKIATIILALVVVGAFAFAFVDFGEIFKTKNPAVLEDENESTPVINDPPVSLIILNDSSCQVCLQGASQLEATIKNQLFPTIESTTIDYLSEEGQQLVQAYSINALPAFLFSEDLKQTQNYSQVSDSFIEGQGAILLDPRATGAGKWIEGPEIGDDPSIGSKDAKVVVIEFSDFQCPFCRAFYVDTERQLLEEYGDEILFVYKDFPLSSIHPLAQKSAEAGNCALEQGKFWEYHDKMFDEQSKQGTGTVSYTVDDLKNWGKEIGLNETKFNECLDSGKYESEVEEDLQQGIEFGVTGTPSFFVNGINLAGAYPLDSFRQVIDEELAK